MDNYFIYTTVQNDTFDMIALDFWNDEFLAPEIIKENPEYKNIIIFDAGIQLKVPAIDMNKSPQSMPPWKR